MKKLITLILAVLMAGLCACGTAEETDISGKTVFLRIKEGVSAQVFERPGDMQAVDTLPGGRICGMLGEKTMEAGAVWFHVFYLKSKKTGAAGYINANDAEQLTEDQVNALMEDSASFNEILDLIEAMNAYLSSKNGNMVNGGEEQKNEMKTLYEKAMDGLKKLFGSGLSSELGKLEEEAKELADKAKEAGEKLLDEAKEAGEKLFDEAKEAGGKLKDTVTDALSSVEGENIGETIDNLKDSISETVEGWTGESGGKIDEAKQKVTDALDILDEYMGEGTGNSIDGLMNFVDKTKDWLNGSDFSKVNDAVNNLADVFKNDGFSKGVGSILDNLKTIFPTK